MTAEKDVVGTESAIAVNTAHSKRKPGKGKWIRDLAATSFGATLPFAPGVVEGHKKKKRQGGGTIA